MRPIAPRSYSLVIIGALASAAGGAFVACDRTRGSSKALEHTAQAEGSLTPPQILSSGALATYKQNLPTVLAPRIAAVMQDSATFWYDHDVMSPMYQDGVPPVLGLRHNNDGVGLINIIPHGPQIFSSDGQTWAFPFSKTAGADDSDNLITANFLSLPLVGGERLPIAYWVTKASLDGTRWRWMFPKGTIVGEVLYLKDASGTLIPVEIRTRERFLSGWATNIFRPFPTAASLASAIKKARPNWQAQPNLNAMINALQNSGTLTPATLTSTVDDDLLRPELTAIFSQSGSIDTLPNFGDAGLVRELLTTTPFVSAYELPWKSSGGSETFAASSNESFSISPRNYKAGLIAVSDESCQRCHEAAQRSVESFNDDAVLYGDVWGSDQIFSFHIFDESLYDGGAGDDNRAVRPAFSQTGMVVPYDAGSHPAAYYRQLPIAGDNN